MFLSVIGLIALLLKSENTLSITSSLIFGLSLIFLYSASTFYHRAKEPILRAKLRVLDHIAIYFLIAGTYTPFALITLRDSIGTSILITIWSIALGGLILKLFFTGRFSILSTALYIGMGWIGVFSADSIMESLTYEGVMLILAGGVSYTVGAILYAIKSLPFNHAIFHVYVLIGSFLHYLCIYFYVV